MYYGFVGSITPTIIINYGYSFAATDGIFTLNPRSDATKSISRETWEN